VRALVPLLALSVVISCTLANGLVVPEVCRPSRPPLPPQAADGPSVPPATWAMKSMTFFDKTPRPGFDFNGSCACASTCKPRNRASVCPNPKSPTDNATAEALFGFGERFKISPVPIDNAQVGINKELRAGGGNVLVTLSDYNGGDNDPTVRVRLFASAGTETKGALREDGTDKLFDSTEGTVVAGYVVNRTLVARFEKARLRFRPELDFLVRDVVLTATLDTAHRELESGVIGAIWPLEDALANFYRTNAPLVGYVCKSTGSIFGQPIDARDIARATACDYVDVMLDGSKNPDAPCNALSFGLDATWVRAGVGAVTPLPVDTSCAGLPPLVCGP
jgi:hypothetical protein